jgi:hypothetical protein
VAYTSTDNLESATIVLPNDTAPLSLQVTNTTYVALSMLNGDAFAKKFGGMTGDDPDYFLLTITGRDGQNQVTGTVEAYLADYRSGLDLEDYILVDWLSVDLSSLGAARTLSFNLSSSDVGQFGMNTPAYVAIDNLEIIDRSDPLPGDANGDDAVDIEDFIILKNAFGTHDVNADFNDNGIVDLVDFDILKQNFGTEAASPVPEPATSVMAVCGLASVWVSISRRRRRYDWPFSYARGASKTARIPSLAHHEP